MRSETDEKTTDRGEAAEASTADDYKWYIVFTKGKQRDRSVERAIGGLAKNGFGEEIADVKMITVEESVEGKNGKSKKTVANAYPRYVYVKMRCDDALAYRIKHLDGVEYILGNGRPEPLSREKAWEIGLEKAPIDRTIAVGDEVIVASGPLAGRKAIVKEINVRSNKAKVAISMFVREIEVEVDLSEIRKAA